MGSTRDLTRRDFLKLLAASYAATALPVKGQWLPRAEASRLSLHLTSLPIQLHSALKLAPASRINPKGLLEVANTGHVPLAETQWNRENRLAIDRLVSARPWGIVLHWYGDKDGFDRTITGYLRGFNDLRRVGDYETRTSAHFLIGPEVPAPAIAEPGKDIPIAEETDLKGNKIPIGIIQTQLPCKGGYPVVASHLRSLNYDAHKNKEQYFVQACYQLAHADPGVHTMLQDWFDGYRVDPNTETFAIEIAGHDFDKPDSQPSEQQIANAMAVVWALIRRYQIPAMNILGHHEICIDNPDPGKKFMARMRFLLGLKALQQFDPYIENLFFGTFCNDQGQIEPDRYFYFVRNFLALTSIPQIVWEWEKETQFWNITSLLRPPGEKMGKFADPLLPYEGHFKGTASTYLDPGNHEGVDLILESEAQARLVEEGICLYAGASKSNHPGKMAFFRHISKEGAELISIYKNLEFVDGLHAGYVYPRGQLLGRVMKEQGKSILHFALAYGASWLTDLAKSPDIAWNVGPTWIGLRFLDPMPYIKPGSTGLAQ